MAQVQVFCQVHLSFTQMVFLAGAHTNGHLCVLRDPAPPATLDRRWFALQLEMGKSVRAALCLGVHGPHRRARRARYGLSHLEVPLTISIFHKWP